MRRSLYTLNVIVWLFLSGLSWESGANTLHVNPDNFESEMNNLQANDHVILKSGMYFLTRPLTLFQHNISLAAERNGAVILDFSSLDDGAQGILIRGNGVSLFGLNLVNPPGDGIVARGVERLVIDQVSVVWWPTVRRPGGYGIYPVMSRHITVTNSHVSGANEAGIYVGQTHFADVLNNHTVDNVIGIDIENSSFVTVSKNVVINNSVGIAVTGRPYLRVKNPLRTRVVDNVLTDNNLLNFAPRGSFAESLGNGVGVLGVAVKELSISGNHFTHHTRADIRLADFSSLNRPYRGDQNYREHISHTLLGENHHNRFKVIEPVVDDSMAAIWQHNMIEVGWPMRAKSISASRLCLQSQVSDVYRQKFENQGLRLRKCNIN